MSRCDGRGGGDDVVVSKNSLAEGQEAFSRRAVSEQARGCQLNAWTSRLEKVSKTRDTWLGNLCYRRYHRVAGYPRARSDVIWVVNAAALNATFHDARALTGATSVQHLRDQDEEISNFRKKFAYLTS